MSKSAQGQRNPGLTAANGEVIAAELHAGNVLMTIRSDTSALESLTVVKLEVTPEGSLLLWLRQATTDEFEGRAAEVRYVAHADMGLDCPVCGNDQWGFDASRGEDSKTGPASCAGGHTWIVTP